MDQRHLVRQLKSIFTDVQVITNARKETDLKFTGTGAYLEFDVWIPTHQIAFEFQDEYHYVTTWYSHKSQAYINDNDSVKVRVAQQQGVTLIGIPVWWDGSAESLGATIQFHRPDLVAVASDEIPVNPPFLFFKTQMVPGVGELMAASFPMDPKFSQSFPPSVWWMGEKYDGIRCCWNSSQRVVYTRTGRELPVLPTIADHMPPIFLDSEFWFGRGLYLLTYAAFKNMTEQVQWHSLRIVSFDVASPEVHKVPFEGRYHLLLTTIDQESPFVITAVRVLLDSNIQLDQMIQNIIDDGGEGAILRRMHSLYECGRAPSLIKVKTSYGDKEGIVVSVEGSDVKLKLPEGKMFTVPAQDVRIPTPSVGDVVTFSFDSYARRDLPVNPKIYRVRSDVSWEDVQHNYAKEKQYLSDHLGVSGFTTQPVGHWNAKNMRAFLENFAVQRGLNPLLAETWYNVPRTIFAQFTSVMYKFKGFFNTLQNLFPEIKFDHSSFTRAPWRFMHTRRKFFERFAKTHGFDPHNPEKWYKQPIEPILATKGVHSVMQYHRNSLSQALLDLFPNIGLDKSKLWSQWGVVVNRKRFFEEYARDHGFDPLVAENWYSQSRKKILATKGGMRVISYHKDSLSKALMDLFPKIGLDKMQLWYKKTWTDPKKRRKFFEDFATKQGLDPSSPENWYSMSLSAIASEKEISKVVYYHNRSVAQAVVDLFPELNLDKSKFWTQWKHSGNRKRLFIEYAKNKGFDHSDPEKWYIQSKESLLSLPGMNSVLAYHKGSLAKALMDLFPNIGLEREKFSTKPLWHQMESRVKFFENYAKEHGFDPHVPANWYTEPEEHILETKGAAKVLSYHNDSVADALMDLFPNIGLHKAKFREKSPRSIRKKLFENYAQAQGFDVKIPGHWYLQRVDDVIAFKGVEAVVDHYQGSVANALIDLFPNIGLSYSSFPFNLQDITNWKEMADKRKFFDKYAEAYGFDPHNPASWYSQTKQNIMAFKGSSKVMAHPGTSIAKTLLEVYPDIGLDPLQFAPTKADWSSRIRRKQFFDDFAKDHGFDPNVPDNWYSVSFAKILATKGVATVIAYHHNRIITALLDLYPNIGLDKLKFWAQRTSNRRKFFEDYAKEHGFIPSDSETWYSQPLSKIASSKGAEAVISYHGDCVKQALIDLFPELGLQKEHFLDKWMYPENRREFFENYARDYGFNPYLPANWYSQPFDRILSYEGAQQVLSLHKDNIVNALVDLFPAIGIDETKFKADAKWSEKTYRRQYFEKYAKSQGFDPRDPEMWYPQSKKSTFTFNGTQILKKFYSGSFANALLDLFPDIGLDKAKLASQASWSDAQSRRKFFENYAQENWFDPLHAEAWYLQPRDKIMSTKGAAGVMYHHNNNYVKALVDLFPDVNFDTYRFWAKTQSNRRRFFEEYAEANRFQVSDEEKWYSVSMENIMSTKGASSVMLHHKNSVAQALIDLFPTIKFQKSRFSNACIAGDPSRVEVSPVLEDRRM